MQALNSVYTFVKETITMENFSRAAYSAAAFCTGATTAAFAYNNVLYSVQIIKNCALPILNGTMPQIRTDLAVGAFNITAGYIDHTLLNLGHYGLILIGICATGYLIGKAISIIQPQDVQNIEATHRSIKEASLASNS
jgi:hypothetical protein